MTRPPLPSAPWRSATQILPAESTAMSAGSLRRPAALLTRRTASKVDEETEVTRRMDCSEFSLL
ncbi:hypothetical protein D3C72_2163360 [compost metagenome]